MTPEELRLKELAEKATPGPWHWEQQKKHGAAVFLYARESDWSPLATLSCDFPTCSYIAAANPATVLKLLARIEKLEEHKRKLLFELGLMMKHYGPDPETRKACLESWQRGEFISSAEFFKQLRERQSD